MTENKAIEIISKNLHQGNLVLALDIARKSMLELEQYRSIGTIEACLEDKNTKIPKNPVGINQDICPRCGTHNEVIMKRRNTVPEDTVYCWHCGQAITIKE